MIKLDLKDRKILYELDLDCRRSFRSIGRKVGLSKDIVTSRVKKLEKNGIIKSYYPIVYPSSIGYLVIRFYFKFQYTPIEVKKEIIDYFVNSQISVLVVTFEGSYDLAVNIAVKNLNDFYSFYLKTLEKYRDYFIKRDVSIYMNEYRYDRSFLIEEKINRPKPRYTHGNIFEVDDFEYKILKILGQNARISSLEIAKKLKTKANMVSYRIKKLIDSKIILGFSTVIDYPTLGYHWMKVDIDLKEYKKINTISSYIEKNPYLTAIDKTVSSSDLEFEFLLKDFKHLNEIIEDLYLKFPNLIKSHNSMVVTNVYKLKYLP